MEDDGTDPSEFPDDPNGVRQQALPESEKAAYHLALYGPRPDDTLGSVVNLMDRTPDLIDDEDTWNQTKLTELRPTEVAQVTADYWCREDVDYWCRKDVDYDQNMLKIQCDREQAFSDDTLSVLKGFRTALLEALP